MRKIVLLTLLASLCIAIHAQTYTFDNDSGTGNGNWNNATNWDPMGVPPNPLPNGSTIIIAANCTQNITRTIENGASLVVSAGVLLTRNNNLTIQGTMTVNGSVTNNTTLSVSAGGMLMNNGTIDHGNTGGDNINNSGTIENKGSINLIFGTLNNQGILHNTDMGVITVSTNALLTNQNQMTNDGDIFNYGIFNAATGDGDLLTNSTSGTITNHGSLQINRTLENDGEIVNYNMITVANNNAAFLNNNASGTITNTLGGTIDNNNILNNAGLLTNNGTLNAADTNNDLFNNTGTLINNLNIIINNGGNLINASGGTLTNNSSLTVNNNGTLTNDGLLNNNSLINNNNNFTNTGTVNNNSGAVINNGNNPGDLLFNTGTVNNNAGATINNNTGATFNSINGSFNNNGTYNGQAPLPIELLSFLGKQQEAAILLKWETASETDNAYMAVERSRDGIRFEEIGQRKGAGTTNLPQMYDFTDAAPFWGINYYRLRQVDSDGKPSYHPIIAIEFHGKVNAGIIQLYPTLADEEMTLVLPTPPPAGSLLRIVDVNGKWIQQQYLKPENTQETVDVSVLPAGAYFLAIQTGTTVQTLRFVKY